MPSLNFFYSGKKKNDSTFLKKKKKKKKASMKPKNIQFCGLAIAKIWNFLEKWHVCIKYSMVEVQIFLVDQSLILWEGRVSRSWLWHSQVASKKAFFASFSSFADLLFNFLIAEICIFIYIVNIFGAGLSPKRRHRKKLVKIPCLFEPCKLSRVRMKRNNEASIFAISFTHQVWKCSSKI